MFAFFLFIFNAWNENSLPLFPFYTPKLPQRMSFSGGAETGRIQSCGEPKSVEGRLSQNGASYFWLPIGISRKGFLQKVILTCLCAFVRVSSLDSRGIVKFVEVFWHFVNVAKLNETASFS